MSEVVIDLQNVSKYYKLYKGPSERLKEALHPMSKRYHSRHYALNRISLQIKKGEILGVVGRNGCGKSTFLKLITGVLQPSDGHISVKEKITALLELGAGFNPDFTGIDNVNFYSKILGLSDKQIKEKLPSIIKFAELGEYLYQPVKTYSSGMKSRLGFSVAVHVDPEILVLDEVLAVGDALFRRKCYAKMEEFFKAGKTIIYVSHDANSINQLCNRAIFIHEGDVIMDGEPREVTKYYEKLLFSKGESVEKIAKEIRTLAKSVTPEIEVGKVKMTPVDEMGTRETKLNPYFIYGLRPSSTVVYQNYDVEIIDPEIRTLSGERVNILVTGECYKYVYRVRFGVDAKEVSLGFHIKDEKGMSISRAALHQANECLPLVKQGAILEVTWNFECALLAGTYYSNNGVSAILDGERTFLTRAVDILVFKVVNKADHMSAGLIDLRQKVKIEAFSGCMETK